MKPGKQKACFHFGALILSAAYLFIVVAHLFFAPSFRDNFSGGNRFALKRNNNLIYNLIRTDRCPASDSKNVKSQVKNHTAPFITLLICNKPMPVTASPGNNVARMLRGQQASYLTNHILRI
jgi:hypothetical protein